jgi:PleD family two-component response regulator
MSIGVTSFQSTEKLEQPVASADAALYNTKRTDKGRVFLLE